MVPIAAVADVGLVVLGGGIGANGDLLLAPIQALLEHWLPYPPKVEVSSLGDAAVLTGALAVGLEAAQDNVFARRAPGLSHDRPGCRSAQRISRTSSEATLLPAAPTDAKTPPPSPAQGDVLQPRRRVAVLDPQALDQLGGRVPRLRDPLARPLAEGARERVDLPHSRLPVLHGVH